MPTLWRYGVTALATWQMIDGIVAGAAFWVPIACALLMMSTLLSEWDKRAGPRFAR